jgi:phage FluMu protein Com
MTAQQQSETHRTIIGLRCTGCGKLLAEQATTPYQIRCKPCGKVNRKD